MIVSRSIHKFAVVCFLVTFAAVSRAESASASQRSDELGLEQLLVSVEQTFPLLKAAEVEQAIADAELLSAEGGFDSSWKSRATAVPVGYYESIRAESYLEKPTDIWGASAFAGWRIGRGEFAVYDGKLQTLEFGEIRGGLNVPVWRNGPIDRRRATRARAEIGRDVARLTVQQQRIEVRRAATHRYWAWVAAGRRLAIANQLLAIVLDRDVGLAARVEQGDVAPVERTDNERAIEQRKAQVASAQRGLEQAAIELGLFVRDAQGNPQALDASRLPAQLPEPAPLDVPLTRDLDAASARRPEAQRLELQRRQGEVEKDFAQNQLAPAIDVQVAGAKNFGRSIAERPDLGPAVLELSLFVDVPLETRLLRGRIDAANAALARLRHQQTFARQRIEADVRDARSALAASLARLDAARREVRLARELESAERVRFNEGDSTILIVNLREQQTAEAELREVEALFDYHRARADLRAARGE